MSKKNLTKLIPPRASQFEGIQEFFDHVFNVNHQLELSNTVQTLGCQLLQSAKANKYSLLFQIQLDFLLF